MLIASWLFAVSNSCSRYSYLDSCEYKQVCCNNECITGSDCLNHYCTSENDCSFAEVCCNKKCRNSLNCEGFPCSTDSDCGFMTSCCHGTCKDDGSCTFVSIAVIVGSVVGGLIFICLVSVCIFFACRQRQTTARPGRVITATTVTSTSGVPRANRPYPRQVPPSYQQGYPYYPPPQSEEHQTAAPPPYNPDATRASDQPPPYSAATQGRSGGVYTPQPSYGAVPPPSKPVV